MSLLDPLKLFAMLAPSACLQNPIPSSECEVAVGKVEILINLLKIEWPQNFVRVCRWFASISTHSSSSLKWTASRVGRWGFGLISQVVRCLWSNKEYFFTDETMLKGAWIIYSEKKRRICFCKSRWRITEATDYKVLKKLEDNGEEGHISNLGQGHHLGSSDKRSRRNECRCVSIPLIFYFCETKSKGSGSWSIFSKLLKFKRVVDAIEVERTDAELFSLK